MTVTLSGQHQLSFETVTRPLIITADQRLLRQIITNLLPNAIKYSPGSGLGAVTIQRAEDHVTLTISDQGIGIPEKDQAHLFSLFHRRANAERIAGTGLGLIIVKEAVEAHAGTIHVESQEGVGTRFMVPLPTHSRHEQTL